MVVLRRRSYGFSDKGGHSVEAHSDLIRITTHGGFLEDPRCLMDLPYLQGDAMIFDWKFIWNHVRETLYWCGLRGDDDGKKDGVFRVES